MDALEILKDCRIVPVVVVDDDKRAVELATTLLDAGIEAIEVTLRTDAALSAIKLIADQVPNILVGAGSVREAKHLRMVSDAGARFAVCPGASDVMTHAAAEARLPFVPGAATASENLRLLEQGYILQKFFPAELNGGTAMIKSLGAPLPEVRFFPTGGVSAKLAASYLELGNVHCIGGTWIATPELLNRGDFAAIAELAKSALQIAADF